jgi:hypothetical protein
LKNTIFYVFAKNMGFQIPMSTPVGCRNWKYPHNSLHFVQDRDLLRLEKIQKSSPKMVHPPYSFLALKW